LELEKQSPKAINFECCKVSLQWKQLLCLK
jgi:hypothetical protein